MKQKFTNSITLFVCVLLLLVATVPTFAEQTPIAVVIEEKKLTLDVAPQVRNGRTLLPLRAIFENLGATVSWIEERGEVVAKRGFTTIRLFVDKKKAYVNEHETNLDAAPITFNKRVLVPTRFVAESLGADVVWDEKKRIVSVQGTKNPQVKIEMSDGGTVTLVLYPQIAPNTVHNFLALTKAGFYDGLIFHRVIPNFMIQGGDPLGQGIGNPGYSIAGEFALNSFKNDLRHTRGIVSMARSRAHDSAGSQFFIMVEEASYLDGSYAAFGKVISGMAVVDRLVALPRDTTDRPKTPPVMKKLSADTFGVSYPEPKKIKLQ